MSGNYDTITGERGDIMKYSEILKNPEIIEYYEKGNQILGKLGYTDHSTTHTRLVAERAAKILDAFGYSEKDQELAKIAGFMHDIGNAINRRHHAEYGAIIANEILRHHEDVEMKDRVQIVSTIANHDESTGVAADPITAAIIIADKTDVRRNRVCTTDKTAFDIHDRVNYAVTGNTLNIDADAKKITLELEIDEEFCTMYEYFDIFLQRMLMSRSAAELLGMKFRLVVNGNKVL